MFKILLVLSVAAMWIHAFFNPEFLAAVPVAKILLYGASAGAFLYMIIPDKRS